MIGRGQAVRSTRIAKENPDVRSLTYIERERTSNGLTPVARSRKFLAWRRHPQTPSIRDSRHDPVQTPLASNACAESHTMLVTHSCQFANLTYALLRILRCFTDLESASGREWCCRDVRPLRACRKMYIIRGIRTAVYLTSWAVCVRQNGNSLRCPDLFGIPC